MNKKCFRVIFSKTLQRLVVVSELAKSVGKSTEQGDFGLSALFACLRPLTFSLYCAWGFVAFSELALAETLIIQADKSAPKAQQPIVLQTANGLPQVNIRTPNAQGLSHNKYSKFDVDTKGAILNNSRTNVQTQQAGWVQGNPYLARGEAKVILNEVNSNDPSVLKGYVEVAGKKADVIIANPSGIHCQGCGVINADRSTFTTGKPHIVNGNLDSFVVEKGKVKVEGKGLDNSRVDYTEILARETQLNAGVWSKKETKIMTGKNTIKRSDSAENVQIIHTAQPLAGENKPQFAVDVGELGGMYAGKIHLIGTENGVGVRNAGHIGASHNTLKIDNQGRLINTGTLNAHQQVDLMATQGIENHGKIENRQGDIRINTPADIQQDGSIVARKGQIEKRANQGIRQQGETVAKGHIRYDAPSVTTGKTALIAAGVQVEDRGKNETRTLDPQSAQGKQIEIRTTGKTTLQGKQIASGQLNIRAAEVNLDHSSNSAYDIEVQAKVGDIQVNDATLTAQDRLSLTTPKVLSTQSSQLTAKHIETTQSSLNAANAVWKQTGTGDFRLKGETVRTAGGTFSTEGSLFIDGKHLDNAGGVLSSGKSVTLNVLDSINSAKGQLIAFENLNLTTNALNNDDGLIYAKQDIGLNSKTHLSNRQTNAENKGIVAGQRLSLLGNILNNTQGKIAAQTLSLNAAELTNNDGLIYAADSLHLNTLKTHNHQGTLSSSKEAVLSFTQLEQEKGQIDAKNLQLNADTLISTNNSLIFAEQLKIEANGKLDNQDSRIVAKTDGRIVSGAPINNRRGIIGSQTGSLALNSDQQRLDNRQGKIVAAKMLALETGELDNDEGMISAADVSVDTHEQALSNRNTLTNVHNKGIMAQNTLQIKAGAVNNHQGYVQSQQDLQITSEEFNNQSGDILTLNKGRLDTAKLHNDGGKIRAEGQLDLNTHTLSQSGGLIKAGTLNMAASTINSTNQSEISAQSINLTADKINHHDSILVATQHIRVEAKDGLQNQRGTIASLQGNLTIDTAQSQLNNAEGTIAAQNAALTLQTGHIDNRQGRMRAKYATIDTRQHTLDNRNTLAEESQGIIVDDLTLNARTVNNQQGRITAKNNSEINIQTLDNQAGQLLTKQQGRLNAKQIDNTQGTIASTNGTLALSADSVLVNRQGNIGAFEQLALSIQGLVNQAGNIIASGRLILDTRQQTIDNQQGRIFALQTAQVDSGAIDNRQGLIRADNRLIINTHQNSLDNRLTQQQNQGIMGAGHIVLKAISELLNQKGTVYAQGALTADVEDRLSNDSGVVKSKGDLVLSAAVLDNQGGTIETKTGTLTATQIDNRAAAEQGSLILGIDSLQLNAHHIDNQGTKARSQLPTQGIQSKNIAIYTERLSNQKGGIYSSDSVNITANSRLDNQQGELLSTNAITVRDHGHLILNNQNGRIQGNNRIDLTAKRLESEGTIKTEGDLSVRLKDSFTLNRAFEVGNNLTFKTDGNFENNTALVVKNKASVAAHQIINNANGEISAAETRLQANSLTNRGVIDGNKTVIDSQEITNIGTGRIYGDHLAIQAQTLNNLAETVNGETHAGTIAARERLDLGIKTLTNRDHSLILSLGDLYIGGELDEHDNAIGRANFVDNGSATIDAMGNGNINSTRLLNHDLYTQTGIHTTKEKIAEHALGKEAQRYRDKRDGYYNVNNGSRNPNSYFQLTNGKRIEGFGWYSWFYTQTTHTTTLDHTDPAQISIGGSLKLDGDDLRNKYSKVLVGQQLWLGDTSFNENSQNTSLEGSKVKLINEDIIGEINKTNEGTYRIEYRVRKKKGRKGHYHYHHNNLKYGPDILPTEHFSFNQVLNTIGNPLTQSGASIEAKVSAKEIELEKVTITPTEQSNLQDMSTVMGDITDGKPVNISLTPFLAENDKHQIVNSGQVIGKLDTTVNGLTQETFDNLKLPVIKTHLTDIRLPQASLYRINPNSPTDYLVETDPKFTQRKQWLSSNYMFNALRYHHDNTHKRLGDGFYEQQLINEQIHQLTGRRYLHGFHNDMEQYKALMNSGVKYAKQFNLTVGIGLTAQQMSALTTDMVWLVNKEVTLADGRKLTVLTPQVYLVARDSDIDSHGAVISANEIISKVGSLKNTGVIAGRDLVNIKSVPNQDIVLDNGLILSNKKLLINSKGNLKLDNGSAIRVLDEDAQLSVAANRIFQSADSVIENLRSEITTIFERYPEFDEEPTSLFRRAKTKGEEYILNKVSNGLPKEEVQKYVDAANALTEASEGIPLDDRNYASIKESENRGNSDELKSYRERLLREQDSVISYWGSKAIPAYRYSENDKKQDAFRRDHPNFALEVVNVLFNPSNKVKWAFGSVKGTLSIFSSTEKALSGAKNTVSKMGGAVSAGTSKATAKGKTELGTLKQSKSGDITGKKGVVYEKTEYITGKHSNEPSGYQIYKSESGYHIALEGRMIKVKSPKDPHPNFAKAYEGTKAHKKWQEIGKMNLQNTNAEVGIKNVIFNGKDINIRKDFSFSNKRFGILKPNTSSGISLAKKRVEILEKNNYTRNRIGFYNPGNNNEMLVFKQTAKGQGLPSRAVKLTLDKSAVKGVKAERVKVNVKGKSAKEVAKEIDKHFSSAAKNSIGSNKTASKTGSKNNAVKTGKNSTKSSAGSRSGSSSKSSESSLSGSSKSGASSRSGSSSKSSTSSRSGSSSKSGTGSRSGSSSKSGTGSRSGSSSKSGASSRSGSGSKSRSESGGSRNSNSRSKSRSR